MIRIYYGAQSHEDWPVILVFIRLIPLSSRAREEETMRYLILVLSILVSPLVVNAQNHCPTGNLLTKKKGKQNGG